MSNMSPPPKRPLNLPLIIILSAYLLVTIGYSIANPLFEAPDEHWHFFTVNYIADQWQLPSVASGDDYDRWLSQEAAQPPLYYLLGSLLIRSFDSSRAREQLWLNPAAWVGDASAVANINRFVHTDAEAWPWHGYALAAHLLRLASTVFGLGTLLCVYANGRLLWPHHPNRAYLATLLVAFLPQFNFLHSSISNDPLIIFLTSLALYQLVWLWHHPATRRRYLLLGLTIGLAALTKNAGILLLVYAIGFVAIKEIRDWRLEIHRRSANRQSPISNLLLILIPALATAGWLWWRNWQLYGDPTAAAVFVRLAGGDRGYTVAQVLAESDGLWKSLFAVFGWFNLSPPEWVYAAWDGLVLLATIGAVGYGFLALGQWNMRQRTGQTAVSASLPQTTFPYQQLLPLLLFGWFAAVYAGLLRFMLQTEAAQGRLLFPAIVPLALGLAYGLTIWPRRLRPGLQLAASLLTFATTIYCLFYVVAPAYQLPDLLEQLPAEASRLDVALNPQLRLLGATVPTAVYHPNDPIPLTLYWQAITTPATPPENVITVLGRNLEGIGSVQGYHGRGLYPATLWPTGKIVAEQVQVRLDKTAVSPVMGRIFVGLADNGQSVQVGTVKIAPSVWPEPAAPPLAQIGDGINLTAVSLSQTQVKPGDTLTLTVQWHVTAPPGHDLTTLVHLAKAGQPPLAQGDSPPLNGNYPTRLWAAGEVIDDSYQLTIPAGAKNGRYPLWIGLYNSETITRLPLISNNQHQPNDLYLVGYIDVQ